MKLRMLTAVITISALALALSACTTEHAAAPTPKPTAPVTTSTEPLDSVPSSGGATLPANTDIALGDGLAQDDGWEEIPDTTNPGRWAYVNTANTCVAAFRQGPLGDAGDMNDREASDALIGIATDTTLGELGEAVGDGYFIRHESGGAHVANRQFSSTVDGQGQFLAVRAFVALDYSVQITVTCEGTDVNATAAEVLGQSAVAVDTDAQAHG